MESRNGCYNRALYANGVWMQDGTMELHLDPELPVTAVPVFTYVPHRMTKECVYTTGYLGQKDPKCIGCKWRKDVQ